MNKRREVLGTGLQIISFILMFGGGIVSLIICVGIVIEVFGPSVAFLSLLLLPILLTVAPWFAFITLGSWFPLVFVYGCGITVAILLGLAGWLKEEV